MTDSRTRSARAGSGRRAVSAASSWMRSRCGSYHRRARSSSAGQSARRADRPMVSTKAVQSSARARRRRRVANAAIGSAALSHAVQHPLRRCRIRCPGISCISRNPATRSRGFSTNRNRASMSLMWAASRNFSPPNLTNGMLRRVSSISSGPLWLEVRNRTACCFSSDAGLAVLQHALDDVARLIGFVADA